MRLAGLWLALMLAACAGTGVAPQPPGTQPAYPAFGRALPAGHTAYDNASLAALFARLTFDTEWGGRRARLARYEAPVRVGLEGPGSAAYAGFLARYTAYLRRHAGVRIATGDQGATLHIRFVDGARFRRVLPAAACVLVPGDIGWEAYAARPDALGGDALVAMETIAETTVFLPQSAPPHAVRTCLLEEIAQALGPINDLYGLGPSIFNDDFAHLWPTRLDLLMLRVLYAPELRSGLSRTEAEAAARAVLGRENPAGRSAPALRVSEPAAAAEWRALQDGIVTRAARPAAQRARAARALALAEAAMPGTPQHCQSLITLGRVLSRAEPEAAIARLDEAAAICRAAHGADDIRLTWARLEAAAAWRALNRPDRVLEATEGLEAPLAGLGQEERLAALYALRAEAYLAENRGAMAAEARRLARGWGAYAFGRGRGG